MSWPEGRVREMVELFNGYPFDSASFSSDGEVPLVRIRDLSSQEFETFVPAPVPENAMLRSGDLVIGMDGDFNAQIWSRGGAALNQRMCALRPRPGIDIRWVAYNLPSHLKFINETQYATTVKHLSSGEVLAIRFAIPSFIEQVAVCDFLDREIAKIDALIGTQEQLIATLREDRAATITQAVTKGLDPNVEMKDCGSGFPVVPAHWQVQPLKLLGRLITGGTPATVDEGNYASSGEGLPWFRPEDLDITGRPSSASRFISDSGRASVPLLSAPSVHVVSIGATLGKVGYVDVDSSSNQQITAVVGADCPRYTYFALVASYERIWASSMGNTLPIISAGRLGTVRIPVPPTNEQASIAHYLDTRCAQIDSLIAKSIEMIETLREYRSALITDAVTGKIDVRGVA
ncbi:hypothetical protein GS486_18180 [Rhodococcus hoagii]|nr:hypothetical protein [Prescottella equi]